nr:hypothetical protein [Clostridiales bacterium]
MNNDRTTPAERARMHAARQSAARQNASQGPAPRSARRTVSAPPAGATRSSDAGQTRRTTAPAGSEPAAASKPKEPSPVQNAFIRSGDAVRVKGGIDRPMLVIILVLIGYGLVMAYSASY